MESAGRHVEQAERLRGENVEVGSAVDKGLGDCHVADGGGAEHQERAFSRRGGGVILGAKGEVSLGRRPARGRP